MFFGKVFLIYRVDQGFMEYRHENLIAVFRNWKQFEDIKRLYNEIEGSGFLDEGTSVVFEEIDVSDTTSKEVLFLEHNVFDWNFSSTSIFVEPVTTYNRLLLESKMKELKREEPESNLNFEVIRVKNSLTRSDIESIFIDNEVDRKHRYDTLIFLLRSKNNGKLFNPEISYRFNNNCYVDLKRIK